MVQCADGWELKAFYHSLKDCFEKIYVSLDEKRTFLWDNKSAIQTFLNFLQRNSSEKSKKKLYVGSLLFLVYLRLFGVESCKKSRKDADKKNKRFFQ